MSDKQIDQKTGREESATKHARGSKKVHSETDNSTEDGFKPNRSNN